MPIAGTVSPGIPFYENAAGDTVWKNEGAVAEIVDPRTQVWLYPGQSIVLAAGADFMSDPALDRTDEISVTSTLAALKADNADGDGFFPGGAFTTGEYVVLDDYSTAHYTGTIWNAGIAA